MTLSRDTREKAHGSMPLWRWQRVINDAIAKLESRTMDFSNRIHKLEAERKPTEPSFAWREARKQVPCPDGLPGCCVIHYRDEPCATGADEKCTCEEDDDSDFECNTCKDSGRCVYCDPPASDNLTPRLVEAVEKIAIAAVGGPRHIAGRLDKVIAFLQPELKRIANALEKIETRCPDCKGRGYEFTFGPGGFGDSVHTRTHPCSACKGTRYLRPHD